MPSVCHSVAQLRILVLNRAGAGAVVYDGKVGVGLRCGETHQPPAVVCRHVEPECSREIARVRVMETHERLAQAAGVRIREAFSPQLHTPLVPDFILQSPAGSVCRI